MALTNEQGQTQRAIGRAYAGEPISLVVLSDKRSLAIVVGDQEREPRPIWFKKECLYRFRADLFAQLRKAHQRQDEDNLTRLWASAERY